MKARNWLKIGAGNETRTRDPDLGKEMFAHGRNVINNLQRIVAGNDTRRHRSDGGHYAVASRRNAGAVGLFAIRVAYRLAGCLTWIVSRLAFEWSLVRPELVAVLVIFALLLVGYSFFVAWAFT